MSTRWIRPLFLFSGLYDALLGIVFVPFGAEVFRHTGVTPPNHMGYVEFPSLLLIVFGIMFLRIAGDPRGRRELILYGMGLKVSYCSVVFWYQLHGGVPALWLPFAWADVVFLALFYAAWRSLREA
ncbi:MAG TPA: hypothetical protein VGN01_15400 [Acidobacteriaceae bacterium]|jgi:hypothetical protein